MPLKKGLFYSSVNDDLVLCTTLEDKFNKYTVTEYSSAKNARVLQNIIARPYIKELVDYIHKILIPNCPVTRKTF